MRNDFLDHYSEAANRKRIKTNFANADVLKYRNNKPRLCDLVYNSEENEYELISERNHFKVAKSAPFVRYNWNVYRYRMLTNFLRSNLGNYWNDIYSEISLLSGNEFHFKEFKDDLLRTVKIETFLKDGEIHYFDYCGNLVNLTIEYSYHSRFRNQFYIHPETNKLCSTWNDYQKKIVPRSQEQNKYLQKIRMTQFRIHMRNKKKHLGEFNYRNHRGFYSFEEAMNDLKNHNITTKNTDNKKE